MPNDWQNYGFVYFKRHFIDFISTQIHSLCNVFLQIKSVTTMKYCNAMLVTWPSATYWSCRSTLNLPPINRSYSREQWLFKF
jgi:hypothetical protein